MYPFIQRLFASLSLSDSNNTQNRKPMDTKELNPPSWLGWVIKRRSSVLVSPREASVNSPSGIPVTSPLLLLASHWILLRVWLPLTMTRVQAFFISLARVMVPLPISKLSMKLLMLISWASSKPLNLKWVWLSFPSVCAMSRRFNWPVCWSWPPRTFNPLHSVCLELE